MKIGYCCKRLRVSPKLCGQTASAGNYIPTNRELVVNLFLTNFVSGKIEVK